MPGIFFLTVRWLARLTSLAVAGTFVLLMIGEFVSPHSSPPTHFIEWFGIALMVTTVVATVLAWRWELLCALIALAALGGFVALIRMNRYGPIYVAALPNLLFIVDWLGRRLIAAQPSAA